MTDPRETAWHEAAHAVLAYRFGFGVGSVTIEAKAELAGVSLSEGEWCDGSKDRQQALVYLAGLAGQRLVRATASRGDGAESDYAEARRLLRGDSLEAAEAEVAELVAANRGAVDAVALALLESGTLRVDEVRDEPGIVIDFVDEGEDWRAGLARARSVWSHFEG